MTKTRTMRAWESCALALAGVLYLLCPAAATAASADPIEVADAAGPQSPAPAVPAASPESAFGVHARWNDRLVFESEDKRFYLQPIGILQSLFSLPINPAGDRFYEGTGFTFRRAALGFDSRLFRSVRTFFLSNIANGTLTLWDFFTDLDYFDGAAVLRVGRFRPWLARQRLLAGDRDPTTRGLDGSARHRGRP